MIRNVRSIVFAAGLCCSAVTAIALEGTANLITQNLLGKLDLTKAKVYQVPQHNWTTRDTHAAAVAWRYIANNTQPETGLVNSVDGFASSTLWDQGSYVFALIAAKRLKIISDADFQARGDAFLTAIGQLELLPNGLPNKVYNTQTLAMTDYADNLTPDGIGWSALDIARLLMALRVLERHNPAMGPRIIEIISDWGLDQMAVNGELIGGALASNGGFVPVQEGRIGYEQYGARSAALWGLDVGRAISADRVLGFEQISSTQVPIDLRTAKKFKTINPTLSEPYVLMGLEMGFDRESAILAKRVYDAQAERYLSTDIMTVLSEDHIDQAPHFVYASIYSNGRDWAVVDIDGASFDDARTQSTKMSFGWDALYNTDYTNLAVDRVFSFKSPTQGWQGGQYEASGAVNAALSLNTNAVVLEALHYTKFGPFWSVTE